MKGLFYSIMIAFIIIPILALIIFYSQTVFQNIDINIRSNELKYFSESIEKDLKRFIEINGKRALISAVSKVVSVGVGLDDAQLRLAELLENGTLYGEIAPLVDVSNLALWKENVTNIASISGFTLKLSDIKINVTQNDSFNVLFNVSMLLNISDENAKMGIVKNITIHALVSIEGIEDPLYPLNTYGRIVRIIKASNVSKTTNPIVTGENASGFVSGYAFVKSDFQASDINSSQILVTNSVAGKETIAAGFAGVVSESDIIIPPQLIGKAITGATNAMNLIKNGTKIYLDETTKKVWDLSNLTLDIKNGYYHSSNEGASFLDRLEGNLILSPKYQHGLESFVYLSDLSAAEVPIKASNSILDYKYWNDVLGRSIRNGGYDPVFNWFKIDEGSAINYGINDLID